jgi:DNA-binding response OmpR family regulator
MNEKILVVDDEPNMLRLLGLTLEHEGYGIAIAKDAREALGKILAEKPDLIILDVMLPGVSGLELCEKLRAQPDTANIPIIMLSAKGEVPDKVAGLKAGADEYVVKPIDTSELVARVGSLLERVRRLRAEQAPKVGKMISFVGAKGGVGTTTTVLNTGMAMAMHGKTVVAAEFRPFVGSFPTMLGLTASKGLGELLVMESRSITRHELSTRLYHHSSGLQVLCAPLELSLGTHLGVQQADAILEGLAGTADYVLVDLAPYPLIAIQAAVQRSKMAVLVVEPVRDCVAAGSAMMSFLKGHAGAGIGICLVIVNRAPMAAPVAPREIQDRLECPVARAIPPAVDECARAQQLGMPVVQSQPESFAAQAYRELASHLM